MLRFLIMAVIVLLILLTFILIMGGLPFLAIETIFVTVYWMFFAVLPLLFLGQLFISLKMDE